MNATDVMENLIADVLKSLAKKAGVAKGAMRKGDVISQLIVALVQGLFVKNCTQINSRLMSATLLPNGAGGLKTSREGSIAVGAFSVSGSSSYSQCSNKS